MSFSYGFYNADHGDRMYNAVQISQLFDGLIGDGIYATIGTSMIVRKSDQPNKVIVGIGRAWFNHTWSYNDSDMLLSGPESDLFLNRIDAIVLDIHSADSSRTNDILWITGSAATNPVRPAMIKEPGHYQYPLAYIYRKTNISNINQEDITNMVGTSETPFVTGILDTLDIDNLLLQWRDQWAQFVLNYEQEAVSWTNLQKTAFENYVSEFEQEMDAWLKSMQDLLGENPAANLQNQISTLKTETNDSIEAIKQRIGSVDLESGLGVDDLSVAINKIYNNDTRYIKFYNFGTLSDTPTLQALYNAVLAIDKIIQQEDLIINSGNGLIIAYFIVAGVGYWGHFYVLGGNGVYYRTTTYVYSYNYGAVISGGMLPLMHVYDYPSNTVQYIGYPMTASGQDITHFKVMTQAEYNSSVKSNDTLYIIVG